jgi:hypothetical protein
MRYLVCAILLASACSAPSSRGGNGNGGAGGGAGSGGAGGGGGSCSDGNAPDLTGCSCGGSAMRACWPASAPAAARGVGACKDGSQTCNSGGEFGTWAACSGATLPAAEICNNGIDDDCNGKADCLDAACATDPACGCSDGQTRSCYDGPAATENVGTCKDGTQTCSGGHWSTTCAGEVLPTAEVCSDALDHDCNHLPGCLDLFSCATNPACQQQCKVDRTGCVCPDGSGDTATCPAGMVGITSGGFPGTVECCPCTASDCTNAVCCAEAVCAGNASCSGLTCKTLPASCGGKVNFDCDDFPEDCDEPCCPCSTCP